MKETITCIPTQTPEEKVEMKKNKFPSGWDEKRVNEVINYYEKQSEEEALAEDEAAYEDTSYTVMEIPKELVPKVRELIAKRAS